MQEPHSSFFALALKNCKSKWKNVSTTILSNGIQQSTMILSSLKCPIYLHNWLAILKAFNAWLKNPKYTIKNHLRRLILHWSGCFVSNNCTWYKVLSNCHPYRQITVWFFPTSKCNFKCFLFSCCRNLPFGGRATRGSRVRLPREEGARSRHQRLFKENVGKTKKGVVYEL